jgi:predicted DNA binding CopG/RHH family protein
MKKLKKIPTFKDINDEKEFWESEDSLDYLDWDRAVFAKMPNLKKSTKTISLRLPEDMLYKLKTRANALDIPYQSLIKMMLQRELSKCKGKEGVRA